MFGHASAWNDHVFVFAMDVGPGNFIGIWHWPANAFTQTQEVVVPVLGDKDNQWT